MGHPAGRIQIVKSRTDLEFHLAPRLPKRDLGGLHNVLDDPVALTASDSLPHG